MPFYMREDIEDVDVPADGAQLVSIWVSKPTVHSKVGITMESDADKAPTIVIETSPGGPAAVAGLRKGDHIIRINGVKVSAARLERCHSEMHSADDRLFGSRFNTGDFKAARKSMVHAIVYVY